eukprot:CAMPEP_0202893130 /NCGR_PEP_ID=MMETSP1392-20130828/2761_1 /ASSEMBLY_ACC=CAM_ASM_000868 /TAXON_ID=225041 /ORGANISM="Chlamydomonas chlamydogama, Strain SAG 11-48b" /LENGTH=191 /DNA_ID=CAMNT_0049577339 /DNA_START=101 /DNA_END=676 /DNA_ORIENTATION=-
MNTNQTAQLLTTQQVDVKPALQSLEDPTDDVTCELVVHDARVKRQKLVDPADAVVVNATRTATAASLPETFADQLELLEARKSARHRNMHSFLHNCRAVEDHHKLTRLANTKERPGDLPRYMDPDDESEVEDEDGPRIFPNTKGQASRLNLQQLQQLQQFYDLPWVPKAATSQHALAVGRRRFMKFMGTSD